LYGFPLVEKNMPRVIAMKRLMGQPRYLMDDTRRDAVLEAMREVCAHRDWNLLAAHVRSTHVHAVVESDIDPEKIMFQFKAYASRRLNAMGIDPVGRKRWARHGSTRRLVKEEDISAAIQYVIDEQGKPMSSFESEVV
jgi:REP element-mobilizing transposase RayT